MDSIQRFFNRRGQALVETAICLPVFILLLTGFFEFSRIFYLWQAITRSAQVGARAAAASAVSSIATTGQNQTEQILQNTYGIPVAVGTVTVTVPGNLQANPILIRVITPVNSPFTPLFPGLAGKNLTATAAAYYGLRPQ